MRHVQVAKSVRDVHSSHAPTSATAAAATSDTTADNRIRHPQHSYLELSRWSYIAVHASLMLVHAFCAAFLLASACLYWYMEHPYLTYFVDLLAPRQDRHFRLVGTVLGCIGALHLLPLLNLVMPRSLFKRIRSYPSSVPASNANTISGPTSDLIAATTTVATTRQRLTAAWQRLFAADGIFGVNSSHFTWISVVLEFTQITTQVYQAHRSSRLISRVWINRCYITIAALFCWTTPLLHHFLRNHSSAERVACMAVDALLNISYSIVLPLVIFIPYLYEYDTEAYSFDLELLYDDQTFGNLVLENQSIFAISLLDCASKLIPHISAYLNLRVIGFLILRSTKKSVVVCHSTVSTSTTDAPTSEPERRPAHSNSSLQSSWQGKVYTAIRFVFVCLGAAIITVHLISLQRLDGISTLGCKQTMHPWLVAKYSCSVFEFNCYRRKVQSPELDSLDFLDENTLSSLVISHCPALVVPPSIRSFPNLLGIEIYNSTIVQWTADAAISASIHQKMVFLLMCSVNMTSLPAGILEPLPDMLQDIEISLTNLTSLPHDLHERWHSLSVLYLEKSEIRVFPETLLQLNVYDLSLIGNQIAAISDLPMLQSNYYVLALSHNPLQTLPTRLPESLTIDFLGLESTKLAALPDWIDASVNELVYLSNSSMCASTVGGSDASGGSMADADALEGAKVTCTEKDPRGEGRYPLYLTQPHRIP